MTIFDIERSVLEAHAAVNPALAERKRDEVKTRMLISIAESLAELVNKEPVAVHMHNAQAPEDIGWADVDAPEVPEGNPQELAILGAIPGTAVYDTEGNAGTITSEGGVSEGEPWVLVKWRDGLGSTKVWISNLIYERDAVDAPTPDGLGALKAKKNKAKDKS